MNTLTQERLEDDHRRLDMEIERMLRWRWADPYELQQLKKQKLAIKDRLQGTALADRALSQVA